MGARAEPESSLVSASGHRVTNVVAIGDVGSTARFHVGDEAMLESVVAHSRRTGRPIEWCVVSADPLATAQRLQVSAVCPLRFEQHDGSFDRALAGWEAVLDRPSDEWGAAAPERWRNLASKIAVADALLIAGGGNLSGSWPGHVAERLALVRAARRRGIPVVITGQTLGPVFGAEDHRMVVEIMRSADVVGVRERASWFVAVEMGVPVERLVLHVDDAAALEPTAPSVELPAHGFIAVTFNSFDAELPPGARSAVAHQIAELSERTGLTVVHVPHEGPIDGSAVELRSSAEDDLDVAATMRCDGDVVMPVPSPAEAVWLAAEAELVVSSRYHPVVMASAHGTPTLFVSQDGYTATKGIGALEHCGVSGWSLPADVAAEGGLLPAMTELWDRRAEVSAHLLGPASVVARSRQHLTWLLDRLCGAAGPSADPGALDPLSPPLALRPAGAWARDPRVAASTGPAWISHHRTGAARAEADGWRHRFAAAEEWAADMALVLVKKDDEIRRVLYGGAVSPDPPVIVPVPTRRQAAPGLAGDDRPLGVLVLEDLRSHVERGAMVSSMAVRAANLGLDDRIVITASKRALGPRVTPFLPIAVLLAAARSHDLRIEGPVDPWVLGAAIAAGGRWASARGLRTPRVAAVETIVSEEIGAASGQWFTGRGSATAGVDGRRCPDALVGLDWDHVPAVSTATRAAWRSTLGCAEQLHLPLVRVTTNARSLFEPTVSWSDSIGAVLAAIALYVRPCIGSLVVPDGLSHDLGAGAGAGDESIRSWADVLVVPALGDAGRLGG